ncbi:hypothetical protein PSV08DRAFT_411820 [Bipolaris maydis]|uniref:uncharacterized protein n=1 Tax=Cochliobolus heterostrophus TaxID=5016 RepID=UPI0024DA93BE|nr:hypothetical protein PSV08DRAFT_411820 [Bipolaris maydis]
MGPDTASLVYAAEPQSISLALQIVQERASRNDNQAAIWSIAKAEGRPGTYILADIAQQIQQLQDRGQTATVHWIPAHLGMPGNKAIDKAAKEATRCREDGRRSLSANAPANSYAIRSTVKSWCKTQAEREWIAKWCTDTKESALLVQLRTEKIGFNDSLFGRRILDVTSPRCDCGASRQTVAHILLNYSKRRNVRNRVFTNLSRGDNLQAILSTRQLAIKVIQYLEQTQILTLGGDCRYNGRDR